MLFPEGIYYDRKNGNYRTERVNIVFDLINSITEELEGNIKGQINDEINLSLCVRMKGLEPPRLAAPDPKSGAATNYATSAFRGAKISKYPPF